MAARRRLRGFGHWVLVVKENVSAYERAVLEGGFLKDGRAVHELLRERALSEGIERMYVVGIDGKNRCVLLHEVARGGLHGCAVSARDILRVVLMGHCSGFILVHNHPSGDPTPSVEDVEMTRALVRAADAVGCPLVDHVVIGGMDSFVSMLDAGILPSVE